MDVDGSRRTKRKVEAREEEERCAPAKGSSSNRAGEKEDLLQAPLSHFFLPWKEEEERKESHAIFFQTDKQKTSEEKKNLLPNRSY